MSVPGPSWRWTARSTWRPPTRCATQLAELLDRDRTDLVIDLRAVRFMDSTGLGVLVGTLKKVRLAGGRLQLVIDSERLLKVFRITALLQVFTVHDTVEAALEA